MFDGKLINEEISLLNNNETSISMDLFNNIKKWSPKEPNLYDVIIELLNENNEVLDKVESYFGLREISVNNGRIYLNDEELYQKLVLDQGYFDESHLTPPSNEELYNDIVKMMKSGFNGARKHQKTEDERYFYYADILGFLTWVEMPSMYKNTEKAQKCFEKEWLEIMNQYYNHPSVIVWTIFNESWGIEDIVTNIDTQNFVNKMYYLTKNNDPYRLSITNDGWEHTISDIISLHIYEQDADKLYNNLETLDKFLNFKLGWNKKSVLIDGYEYQGQPIMIDEFGGAAYVSKVEGTSNWGYGNIVNDDEFIKRYKSLRNAIEKLQYCSGYCYTQFSDVQQEVNGLLDEKHQYKFDVEKLK